MQVSLAIRLLDCQAGINDDMEDMRQPQPRGVVQCLEAVWISSVLHLPCRLVLGFLDGSFPSVFPLTLQVGMVFDSSNVLYLLY